MVSLRASALVGVSGRIGNGESAGFCTGRRFRLNWRDGARLKPNLVTANALQDAADKNRRSLGGGVQSVNVFWQGAAKTVGVVGEVDGYGNSSVAEMGDAGECAAPLDAQANESALDGIGLEGRDALDALDNLDERQIGGAVG